MPPLPPFDVYSVLHTNAAGEQPYQFGLKASPTGEVWSFELPADRGAPLAAYLDALGGSPADRAEIVKYLNA